MTSGAREPEKVVHRVVKRTVVRPVAPPPARRASPVKARPTLRLPQVTVGPIRATAADAAWAVRDRFADATGAVRTWRIPQLAPVPASIVTGLVCGAVVTVLGAMLLAIFEWTRGTATGGGLWGSLSVGALLVTCSVLGGWLLRRFGSPQPAGTSLLAVALSLTGTLLLVEPANGPWAAALIPTLIVLGYVIAARLTDVVSRPENQR